MERKDEEMKDVISRLWPIQSKKILELLVPPKEGKLIGVAYRIYI